MEEQLKLLIIGESGVGKTSILQRFIDNTFQPGFTSTIGIDFRAKKIKLNGKQVELQIWDTAGQERFFSITKSYYRGADGIFLTFDLSAPESFSHTEKWISAVQGKVTERVPIFLLANKKDLVSHKDIESLETVRALRNLGRRLNVPWYTTSARSGENVEEIFHSMAVAVLEHRTFTPARKKDKYGISGKALKRAFWCW